MINEIVGAVLQLLAFALIPFLVFVIKTKSTRDFWNYIGLKKSTRKANLLALLVMLLMVVPMMILMFTNEAFKMVLIDPSSVTGKIRLMGASMQTVVIIIFTAIVKTALSEEIFFRGFLAKRLIASTNFQVGNIIHAIIFGAIHGLLFISITRDPVFLLVIFLFPTLGAYFKVYLNEQLANGSIVPGWIAHGLGNLIAYTTVAFFI